VTLLGQWDRGPLVHLKRNSSGYVHQKFQIRHMALVSKRGESSSAQHSKKWHQSGFKVTFQVGLGHHQNHAF
jgi:hypothetical protein